MLHHPHRILEELKTVEDIDFKTFVEVYDHCCVIYIGIYLLDYYRELPLPVDTDEFEEDPSGEDNMVCGDWEELVRQFLQRRLETEDLELLSNCDIDFIYDWTLYVDRYLNLT